MDKEYYAQVHDDITDDAIGILKSAVEIGFGGKKYVTKPSAVFKLEGIPELPTRSKKTRDDNRYGPTSWVSITLNEGKFRQVRKMDISRWGPYLKIN